MTDLGQRQHRVQLLVESVLSRGPAHDLEDIVPQNLELLGLESFELRFAEIAQHTVESALFELAAYLRIERTVRGRLRGTAHIGHDALQGAHAAEAIPHPLAVLHNCLERLSTLEDDSAAVRPLPS